MQGPVSLNYLKVPHKYLVKSGRIDGKRHVLVLDEHYSHVNLDVVKLAVSLNIELFQLLSHSSYIAQLLAVAAFSIKREITTVQLSFGRNHGGRIPVKSDMIQVIREAWE